MTRGIGIIMSWELRRLFFTPLAWTILAIVQLIAAYIIKVHVAEFMRIQGRLLTIEDAPGVTELVFAQTLTDTSVIFILVMPLITMRLLSDEKRNGTMQLLFSAPISNTEIVLGKLFSSISFNLIIVFLFFIMSFALFSASDLDIGILLASLLGLFLLIGAFSAIGLYCSSLTEHPALSATLGMGLLFLLWIVDWLAPYVSGTAQTLVNYASVDQHFRSILTGNIQSMDVVYFLVLILFFTLLTIRHLDNQRLQA